MIIHPERQKDFEQKKENEIKDVKKILTILSAKHYDSDVVEVRVTLLVMMIN